MWAKIYEYILLVYIFSQKQNNVSFVMIIKVMDPARRPSFKTIEIQPENPPQPVSPPVEPANFPPAPTPPAGVNIPPQTMVLQNNRPAKRNHMSKFMFIIPALFVLATIFLAGYFTNEYLKSSLPKAPTNIVMPTLIPATPAPTPKVVVKNKIYFNSDLSYSFAYPENMALVECELDLYLFPALSIESDVQSLCKDPKGAVIALEVSGNNLYQKGDARDDVEEELITVSGYDAILQKITQVGQTKFIKKLSFEGPDRFYLISLLDASYDEIFEGVYGSLSFDEDLTDDWRDYESGMGFDIKIPSDWQALEQDGQLLIHKGESDVPHITFEVGDQGDMTPAELINSIKNLPGWKIQPKIDLRSVDSEIAHVVKGQLNGEWYSFVAVWYNGKLMQIAFTDNMSAENEIIFEVMLGTIDILPGI